jgi:hypothetical protein
LKINQALAVFLERLQRLDTKSKEQFEALNEQIEVVRDFKLIPGDKGETGEQGLQGIEGPTGRDGLQGEQGVQGPRGETGAQGSQGLQGVQGEQGQKGERGEKGQKGDKGERGERGPEGKKGQDGKPGRIPRHKIQNGAIAFEQRPNEYGDWIRFTQTNQYISGGGGKTWIDYVVGYTVEPTLVGTYGIGEVYQYTYSSETLYRVIGNTQDSFYRSFSDGQASDLVIAKAI